MVQAEAGDAHVASFGPTATNLAAAAAPARCACAFMHARMTAVHLSMPGYICTLACVAACTNLHARSPVHIGMHGQLYRLVSHFTCRDHL